MPDSRMITGVEISRPRKFGGEVIPYVRLDKDPGWIQLFSYFADEIGFSAHELLGKTVDQAHELYQAKYATHLQH